MTGYSVGGTLYRTASELCRTSLNNTGLFDISDNPPLTHTPHNTNATMANIFNEAEFDETDNEFSGKMLQNKIHIRIQQRNGRKTITTLQGKIFFF